MGLKEQLEGVLSRHQLGRAIAAHFATSFGHDAFFMSHYTMDERALRPLYGEDTPAGGTSPEECPIEPRYGIDLRDDPLLINREAPPPRSEFDPFGETQRFSLSLMFTPVFLGGRKIATMSVQSYTQDKYTEADLRRFHLLCQECAEAIQRVREAELQTHLWTVLEQSPGMILVTDQEGRIDYVNRALLEATGYRLSEIRGLTPRIFKSGLMDEAIYQGLWDTLLSGREWRGDMCNRRKDGSTYWVHMCVSPLRDPDGVIRHFVAIQEDITERKRESEEKRLRVDILEAISYAAARFLEPTDWRNDLEEALRRLGSAARCDRSYMFENVMTPDGELHMRLLAQWAERDEYRFPENFQLSYTVYSLRHFFNGISTGAVYTRKLSDMEESEAEILRANKGKSYCAVPIFTNNKWDGYIGLTDCQNEREWSHEVRNAIWIAGSVISAARTNTRVQEALHRSEDTTRSLLDASPVAAMLLDGEGRFLAVNRPAESHLGYPAEELLGLNALDFFPSPIARRREEYFRLAIESMKPVEFEDVIDGRILDVHINPVPGNKRGGPKLAMYISDITEERRNERLAALGQTAVGVAHYIRNVQTTLNASTRLIDEALRTGNESVLHQAWPVLQRSADRVNHLLRDMLTVARASRSTRFPICINAILGEIAENASRRAGERGIRITTTLDPDLPRVLGDPSRLHDALLNIVMNAVDAFIDSESTPDRRIDIRTYHDSGVVHCEISDNGPGIPKELRDRIFEPFFTTKGSAGTGLGLAVCKSVINEHRGHLDLKSKLGVGTTFHLRFDAHTSPMNGSTT